MTCPNYFKQRELQYDQTLCNNEYVVVRIDGRSFHTFTKNFERPFDSKFIYAMNYVARKCKELFNADFAYVQSDEVSFGWSPESWLKSQIFSGRINKINSCIASTASVLFKDIYTENHAIFDCRTFTLKDVNEYRAYFMWRYRDCYKNAITMIAQSLFSHEELHQKNTDEKIFMISCKEIDVRQIEKRYIHGAMFYSSVVERVFLPEELEALPEKHEARINPNKTFLRNIICVFSGELKEFIQTRKFKVTTP